MSFYWNINFFRNGTLIVFLQKLISWNKLNHERREDVKRQNG